MFVDNYLNLATCNTLPIKDTDSPYLTFYRRVRLWDNDQELVLVQGTTEWYQMYRVVLSLLVITYSILLLLKQCIWLVFLGHLNLPSSPKLHMICCGLYPQFDEILFNKKTLRRFIFDNELRAKRETYSQMPIVFNVISHGPRYTH